MFSRHQYFEDRKDQTMEKKAAMQVNFAENGTLTAQNQIQAAYFKQRQVTIFTCCIWVNNEVKSVATISDD